MKHKLLFLFVAAALGVNAADVITMKNGDRVSGAIVKKDGKTLTVKSEHFGLVTLPWDQIATVNAEQTLNVVTPAGTVQSKLATKGDKIEVAANEVAPADIVAIRDAAEQKAYERMLKPRLSDLWAVGGSIGWAGTSGNAKTLTFTTPINAARISNTSKTNVYFNSIRASALINGVSASTASAVRGGWGYARNLRPRLFANVFNDWEYDRFQNLDLRVVAGGGLGYQVWKGERGRLDVLGGLAWNREKFDPVRPRLPFVRNAAEGYYGNDFTYKLNSRTSFFQNFRQFTNLQNGDQYRINFDAGATTQLTKWLNWNVAFSNRFLNLPAPGRKKNDLLYTTGFGFSFAR
jgi:putative salt-induced outer membrane protein YdiY